MAVKRLHFRSNWEKFIPSVEIIDRVNGAGVGEPSRLTFISRACITR